jgi:hypothetical protein
MKPPDTPGPLLREFSHKYGKKIAWEISPPIGPHAIAFIDRSARAIIICSRND